MNGYSLTGFFDELECIQKEAGLLRPEQPRARDIIKGRGPEKRRARTVLRDKLRAGCPTAENEKMAGVISNALKKIKATAFKKKMKAPPNPTAALQIKL